MVKLINPANPKGGDYHARNLIRYPLRRAVPSNKQCTRQEAVRPVNSPGGVVTFPGNTNRRQRSEGTMIDPYCKECGKRIPARGENLAFVRYEDKYVDVVPTAEGGMTPMTLDAGVFCCDMCLVTYLGKKIDKAVHRKEP